MLTRRLPGHVRARHGVERQGDDIRRGLPWTPGEAALQEVRSAGGDEAADVRYWCEGTVAGGPRQPPPGQGGTHSRLASRESLSITQSVSLSSSFPFVRGEVLPATSSPSHLIVFSTLLCLLSSSSSLLPLFLPPSVNLFRINDIHTIHQNTLII